MQTLKLDYKRTERGKQTPAETDRRYMAQLHNMLRTACRMGNARVIAALSGLIAKRGGA